MVAAVEGDVLTGSTESDVANAGRVDGPMVHEASRIGARSAAVRRIGRFRRRRAAGPADRATGPGILMRGCIG